MNSTNLQCDEKCMYLLAKDLWAWSTQSHCLFKNLFWAQRCCSQTMSNHYISEFFRYLSCITTYKIKHLRRFKFLFAYQKFVFLALFFKHNFCPFCSLILPYSFSLGPPHHQQTPSHFLVMISCASPTSWIPFAPLVIPCVILNLIKLIIR